MSVNLVTTLSSVTTVYKDNYGNVSNNSNPINIGNLTNKGNQDNVRNQSSHKCTLVLMQSISHFCSILDKPQFSRQILVQLPSTKCHKKMSNVPW